MAYFCEGGARGCRNHRGPNWMTPRVCVCVWGGGVTTAPFAPTLGLCNRETCKICEICDCLVTLCFATRCCCSCRTTSTVAETPDASAALTNVSMRADNADESFAEVVPEGIRRGSRSRVTPCAYWKNERPIVTAEGKVTKIKPKTPYVKPAKRRRRAQQPSSRSAGTLPLGRNSPPCDPTVAVPIHRCVLPCVYAYRQLL